MRFIHKGVKDTHTKNRNRGVVILIAIVVASLVLVLGIGITSIITKELVLTNLGKNSRSAFFAADAGIDCATHWDLVNMVASAHSVAPATYPGSIFPKDGTEVSSFNPSVDTLRPFCEGLSVDNVFGLSSGADDYLYYYFTIADPVSWVSNPIAKTKFVIFPGGSAGADKPCALVTVSKEVLVGGKVVTIIESEGFSTCGGDDARRVSRGIKVEYEI